MFNINEIKRIELLAYPEQFAMMQDCSNLSDIADYCECNTSEVIIIQGEYWYALVANNSEVPEFIDIAKMPDSPIIPWHKVLEVLHANGIQRVKADLRKKTSFKVLKRFGSKFGVTFEREHHYYDDYFEEEMVEVILALG